MLRRGFDEAQDAVGSSRSDGTRDPLAGLELGQGQRLLGNFNNWSSDGPLAAAPSADLARAAKNIFLSFFQHFTDSQWAILA